MNFKFSKQNAAVGIRRSCFTILVGLAQIFLFKIDQVGAAGDHAGMDSWPGTITVYEYDDNNSSSKSIVAAAATAAAAQFPTNGVELSDVELWALLVIYDRPQDKKGFLLNSDPVLDTCDQIPPPGRSTGSSYIKESFEPILLISNADINQNCSVEAKITIANKVGFKVVIIHNKFSNDTEILGSLRMSSTFPSDLVNFPITIFSVGDLTGTLLKDKFNSSQGFYVEIVTDPSTNVRRNVFLVMACVFVAALILASIGFCIESYRTGREAILRLEGSTINNDSNALLAVA